MCVIGMWLHQFESVLIEKLVVLEYCQVLVVPALDPSQGLKCQERVEGAWDEQDASKYNLLVGLLRMTTGHQIGKSKVEHDGADDEED